MADKGHKPTSGMKSAAKRALEWRKQGNRGGTAVGVARANQIVSGESLSDDTVKRMYSFFSRHEVDKKATGFNSGEEGYPSPGRVAWDLWGGDSGFAFARSKVKHTLKKMIEDELEKVLEKSKKSIRVGQMVSWGSSGGNAKGKVVKIKRDGSINVPDSDFTITGTEDNPAVLIRIYKDGKPTDTLVGHKMKTLNIIGSAKKAIGTSSSVNETEHNDSHIEYYVGREKYIKEDGGEKNMSEEIVEKASTEPDPEGDIAVTKSANSDLARSDIEKAIEALTAIAKSLPDVSRADSVTVDNETLEKSTNEPDVSRAGDVTVSNETAPIAKNVGDPDDVEGQGENSKPANEPVDMPQEVITKSTCGEEDCSGEDCAKCMNKDMEMVTKSEDGGDEKPEEDKDDKNISKSVWGGAFGPTHQVSIGVFQK